LEAIGPNGSVHALITTAGLLHIDILERVDAEKLIEIDNVQLYGSLRLLQSFGPLMRKAQNPRLILSSSPAGCMAIPIMGPNTIGRHATEGFAKVAYLEGRAWPNPMQVC